MAGFGARAVAGSWFNRYKGLQSRVERVKEKAEEAIGSGLQLAEVGGTCLAFSYANARSGKPDPKRPGITRLQLFGADADLAAAVALHGVAFLGGLGKYSEHGHNVADGAAASYLARLGTEMGSDARVKANQAAAGMAQITGAPAIVGASENPADYVQRYTANGSR